MKKNKTSYYNILKKIDVINTEKSKEIIKAFDKISDKNASPTSLQEYIEKLDKRHNKR